MKRSNILSKLKSRVKLIESILTEGDHWPEDYRRKAINRIKLATAGKTPTYSENDIESAVDKMVAKFEPLSHKNSNFGYFLPIIRMFIDYVGNDEKKRKEFVDNKMDMLVKTLGLISSDPSLESKFKDDIKQKWTLEDFEKHAAELQAEINKADADSLASVGNSESGDYDVILIESYEELHEKFGGNKTGYKGQSEWCHANGRSTYDSWTEKGAKQFFVLAKKGWENIQPPDPKTTNAFDEYGKSLIAILVKVEDCELLRATLRWNHIIEPSITVPKTSVDKAFLGWGDLSKMLGFNVKAVVEKEIKRIRDELDYKIKNRMTVIIDKLKAVTEIDEYALTKDEKQFITQLDIPNNVTSIGDEAFRDCRHLINVTIPDSVTRIEERAFENCYRLENVTIGNGVTGIGWGAFSNCWKLSSVTMGNSVTSIENSVFSYCYDLSSITIPDSVTSIGDSVFYDCHDLTSVTIPDSVTKIGERLFHNCYKLTTVTIPDSVKSIGNDAFSNCKSLTSVTIPDSVTSIGDGAFRGCWNLTSVTIPNSVTSIGANTFSYCYSLTSVTIPNSVTSIGNSAFLGCHSLTSVTIPDSVTRIGWGAFRGCRNLTSVTIPNSVTSIADWAFCGCEALTQLTIPDSVKSIGPSAFAECYSLTNITISEGVTRIGNSAFFGCNKLSSVTFEGKTRDQVRSMLDYPWGIKNSKEVIRVTDASN